MPHPRYREPRAERCSQARPRLVYRIAERLGQFVDRRGRGVASDAKDSEIDPRRGRGRFGLCRDATVPGRFKIRGKLSVYDGWALVDVVWLKPGRFRLRRP